MTLQYMYGALGLRMFPPKYAYLEVNVCLHTNTGIFANDLLY